MKRVVFFKAYAPFAREGGSYTFEKGERGCLSPAHSLTSHTIPY